MSEHYHHSKVTEMPSLEREIIRVDFPMGGIAVALRRAFQAAAEEPSNRDFDALLRSLN